jgi:hypothetical protein
VRRCRKYDEFGVLPKERGETRKISLEEGVDVNTIVNFDSVLGDCVSMGDIPHTDK